MKNRLLMFVALILTGLVASSATANPSAKKNPWAPEIKDLVVISSSYDGPPYPLKFPCTYTIGTVLCNINVESACLKTLNVNKAGTISCKGKQIGVFETRPHARDEYYGYLHVHRTRLNPALVSLVEIPLPNSKRGVSYMLMVK